MFLYSPTDRTVSTVFIFDKSGSGPTLGQDVPCMLLFGMFGRSSIFSHISNVTVDIILSNEATTGLSYSLPNCLGAASDFDTICASAHPASSLGKPTRCTAYAFV